MALQVFSLIVLLGALIILIPTARRVFGKKDDEYASTTGPARHMLAVWLIR